jgi:hypothetical protein
MTHLSTVLQAMGLVYVIGFGMVLFGAAIELTGRTAAYVVSWMGGLMR